MGAREHAELWVPAEDLEEFNRRIRPPIQVVGAFFGDGFRGREGRAGALEGKDAVEQFVTLAGLDERRDPALPGELRTNDVPVFLHHPFWRRMDFAREGIPASRRDRVIESITRIWKSEPGLSDRPLPELDEPGA